MTHKLILPSLLLCCILILISCKDQNKDNSNSSSIDTEDFNKLISDWNNANASKDIGVLSNLYDSTIFYYGTQKDKNFCIESKLTFFKKNPDYYQQIYGDIKKEKISDLEIKCSFIKRVTLNQKTKDYPSYIIFTKRHEGWKISTEGDLVTDKYLAKAKKDFIPEDATKGDFNGDGVLDYAWLVPPKTAECEDCDGNCTSYINFSDKSIPSIKVEMCIGGTPTNLGDLNNNGSDEIGILPSWCTSCWRGYNVYTYKNEKWVFAVEPFSTHCNQWEEGVKPIEIDLNKAGNVLIRYSEHTGEDIVTKTKSVPIN